VIGHEVVVTLDLKIVGFALAEKFDLGDPVPVDIRSS